MVKLNRKCMTLSSVNGISTPHAPIFKHGEISSLCLISSVKRNFTACLIQARATPQFYQCSVFGRQPCSDQMTEGLLQRGNRQRSSETRPLHCRGRLRQAGLAATVADWRSCSRAAVVRGGPERRGSERHRSSRGTGL